MRICISIQLERLLGTRIGLEQRDVWFVYEFDFQL